MELFLKDNIMYEFQTKQIVDNHFPSFGLRPHCMPNAIGMIRSEQEALTWLALNSDPNYNWIETGSFCGGSAVLLCLARRLLKGGPSIVSVDRSFNVMFDVNLARFRDISKKLAIDTLELDDHYDKTPISFALVDGWHSFKGCLHDFDIINKYLTDNAYVAFHDVEPITEDNLDALYDTTKVNYEEWMKEQLPRDQYNPGEKFHIEHCMAYIIKERGFELVKFPDNIGVGKNGLAALRKTGNESWNKYSI